MKYLVTTEFIGHERHIDVLHDTPVMGASIERVEKHIEHGPFKTRKSAEDALKPRKAHWQKVGFRKPPKSAEVYDKDGNYMFRPFPGSNMSEKMRKKIAKVQRTTPDHITFSIEERDISREVAR